MESPIEENTNDDHALPNAVAYIKSSAVFSDPKNDWVSSLVEKILVDENVSDNDIRAAIFESDADDKLTTKTTTQIQKSATYTVVHQDVRRLNEITNITNVGLLDITSPLPLEDGLNIFYGKNGAGKSSIYLGLCRILGKEKPLYPDIESSNEESSCTIKYKNQADVEDVLSWKTGADARESSVMIFDGEISQTLVENDQDNAFEIAHLQVEYFTYLRELYERIESIVTERIRRRGKSITETEEALADDIPSLAETSEKELDEMIVQTFTAEERAELGVYLRQKETLNKGAPEAELKNLATAKNTVLSVLEKFGKVSEDNVWMFLYDHAELVELNRRVRNLNVIQKAFEESGVQKVASIIPADWIRNETWTTFIEESLAFAETLDDESRRKYSEEICIYCQQPLATPESKKLISAYTEMGSEIEAKLRDERRYFQEQERVIDSCIAALGTIIKTNSAIETEFSAIARADKISLDKDALLATFGKIRGGIIDFSEITLSKEEQDGLLAFYSEYKSLFVSFGKAEKELERLIANKKDSIVELDKNIAPLQEKSHIEKHRKALSSYIANRKAKGDLDHKLSDIYALKASRSRLESEFAKVAGLLEFQERLKKEYSALHFSPPSYWKLSTITPGGVNKRAYRLNDKRLADIFSEGERKLHSLADFFTQCEVNKYKGVYIFDDPVNSLDEANIQNVADRILKLVESDNQVIVFTHNLYFLNALDKNSNQTVYKITKTPTKKQIVIEGTRLDTTSSMAASMRAIVDEMTLLEKAGVRSTIQIGAVYDLISGYIEDYVEKVLFKNIVSRYRANIRMTSLSSLPDISKEKVAAISNIYEHASRGGNRHSNPTDIPEPTYEALLTDYALLQEHCDYKK